MTLWAIIRPTAVTGTHSDPPPPVYQGQIKLAALKVRQLYVNSEKREFDFTAFQYLIRGFLRSSLMPADNATPDEVIQPLTGDPFAKSGARGACGRNNKTLLEPNYIIQRCNIFIYATVKGEPSATNTITWSSSQEICAKTINYAAVKPAGFPS